MNLHSASIKQKETFLIVISSHLAIGTYRLAGVTCIAIARFKTKAGSCWPSQFRECSIVDGLIPATPSLSLDSNPKNTQSHCERIQFVVFHS